MSYISEIKVLMIIKGIIIIIVIAVLVVGNWRLQFLALKTHFTPITARKVARGKCRNVVKWLVWLSSLSYQQFLETLLLLLLGSLDH